jgi:adenylate kinase family enzyme
VEVGVWWSGRRGSLLAGLSQVISPEIAQAMIGRGVPPSLVVPVRFEPSRLAQHRLKSEFAWNPPSVPVGGESKADDGAPPPSPEELETAKEEARSAKLEALVAACNDDRDRLAGVEKVFEEAGVAIATPIDGNANSLDRVLARLEGVIAPVLTGAVSVVTTAASVAPSVVSSLLQSGSRRLSKFGPYCPVALKESGDLVANTEHPVVYRNHVYMLSSSAAAAKFAANPAVYVSQAAPPPKIPPSCAIVGPEFSGRSSAAAAVAKENGMELVTVTRAIEDLLRPESSDTALRRKVLEFLAQGQSLPDALAAEAIAKYVSTLKCAENGYVLDGFPNTPAQAAALSAVGVIPRSVYLLNVPEPELYARAVAATDCETQRLELGLGPQVLTRSLTAVKKIKRRKPTTPAESKLDDDGGGVEDQNGGEDDAADGSDEEHGDARVAMTVRPGEWPEVSARIRSGLLSTEDVLAARSPWNGGHIPVAPDSNRAASIIKRIASQHDNCVQLVDGFAEQFDNVKAIDASGAQSRWGIARAISSSLRDATKHAREYARAVGTGRYRTVKRDRLMFVL